MIRLIALASLLLSAQAVAEPSLGTRDFAVREIRHAGDLAGCAIDFSQLLQDRPYGLVQVIGTIALETPRPGTLQWTLKLLPGDLRLDHGVLGLTPFQPATAAITGTGYSTAGHEAARPACDGVCAIFVDEPALMTLLAAPNGFTVTYRRQAGGPDIRMRIADPSPRRRASLAQFRDCTLAVFGASLTP